MHRIDWHSGYDASIPEELAAYKGMLEFERNHPLNEEALEIDFLVVRKNAEVQIEKNFGRIFRRYNIFEFKSPKAALDIDVFFKVNAYACLYKAYGTGVDAIGADEITISFIRDIKPVKLFKDFKKYGFEIENIYPGIYYVHGKQFFPVQIIVGRELPKEENPWLRCMTFSAEKADIYRLLEKYHQSKDEGERQHISAVMQVLAGANKNVFTTVWRENYMLDGTVLEELMEAVGLDKVIAEKDRDIAEKDRDIAEKDRNIAEKDRNIAEMSRNIAEKDSIIAKLLEENAALKSAKN